MDEKSGWVKLYRSMLKNPIVMKDADHLAVWVYLLLNATHEEHKALFKGKKITMKAGQVITGSKSISCRLSISESKVRRVLDAFKSDGQIDKQTSNKNSLITILSWDLYQQSGKQNDGQMTDKWRTSDGQVTDNRRTSDDKQECKEGEECKNERSTPPISPPGDFDRFWAAYPKKVGKQAARKAFSRVKIPVETLLTAIEQQKCSDQWSKGYIPNPATWLNQGRWEDELQSKAAAEPLDYGDPLDFYK